MYKLNNLHSKIINNLMHLIFINLIPDKAVLTQEKLAFLITLFRSFIIFEFFWSLLRDRSRMFLSGRKKIKPTFQKIMSKKMFFFSFNISL